MYSVLAAAVVVAHVAFVLFASLGALLVVRWPRVAWLHLPAVAWAAFVELSGRLCPLTPLENTLRQRAGLDAYSSDFIARYVFPVLYPNGLTRDAQIVLGVAVLAINVAVYAWLLLARARRRRGVSGGIAAPPLLERERRGDRR
jgi:hypothetical protein